MDGQMLDSCPSCFLHSQGTCQLTPNFLKGLIGQKQGLNHYVSPCHFFYDVSLFSFFCNPRCSMYGVFTYIWPKFMVNVGKYTIH